MQHNSITEMMMLSKSEQQFLYKRIGKSLKKWKKKQLKESRQQLVISRSAKTN
ncbi:MAG: hypothetical protein K1X63_08245 [Chitinophagales bacterium]|nr:hypothetical protein [Chitinophagales bacterium]